MSVIEPGVNVVPDEARPDINSGRLVVPLDPLEKAHVKKYTRSVGVIKSCRGDVTPSFDLLDEGINRVTRRAQNVKLTANGPFQTSNCKRELFRSPFTIRSC